MNNINGINKTCKCFTCKNKFNNCKNCKNCCNNNFNLDTLLEIEHFLCNLKKACKCINFCKFFKQQLKFDFT